MWAGDAESGTLAMGPVVRHFLDFSVQQGQPFQELAHGLHTITQELLRLKHTPLVATVPLRDPAQDAQHLFTKPNADNDVKAFLGTFGKTPTSSRSE